MLTSIYVAGIVLTFVYFLYLDYNTGTGKWADTLLRTLVAFGCAALWPLYWTLFGILSAIFP